MLQFILGLAAGIVVTLIMEWVIDWSGLAAGRTMVRARSSATYFHYSPRKRGLAHGAQAHTTVHLAI